MAMLHEDWKSRTILKQVMVVNTDAKITVSYMLTIGKL